MTEPAARFWRRTQRKPRMSSSSMRARRRLPDQPEGEAEALRWASFLTKPETLFFSTTRKEDKEGGSGIGEEHCG